MLWKLVVLGLALLLNGCAMAGVMRAEAAMKHKAEQDSTDGLTKGKPAVRYVIQKAPTALARCISQGWLKNTNSIASVVTPSGYVLSIGSGDAGADCVVSIDAASTGSMVKYMERSGLPNSKWMSESVVACRQK